MWAKRLSTALLVFNLSILPAYAGSSTISLFDSGLAARVYDVITDGIGNFVAKYGLCDGVAAAQCATVKVASTAAVATDPAVVVAVSPNNSVFTTPKTAAFVTTGCTVTTSSTQCLATGLVVNHVSVQNTSATAIIACNWGGTAILNSGAGSFMLPNVGSASLWGPSTAGVPGGALNCIGSVAGTLYVEYN